MNKLWYFFPFFLVFNLLAMTNRESNEDTKIYRQEKSKKIMCPVLAGLYNKGLIIADDRPGHANNLVEKRELEAVLVNDLGNHFILGRFQAHGVVTYTLDGLKEKRREREFFGKDPRYLDIFDMHNDPQARHGYGSAVRENEEASVQRFNNFIGSKFVDGRLYISDLANLLTYARNNGEKKGEFSINENDDVIRYNWQMSLAMTAFVETFGKLDEENKKYITIKDAEKLYLEGQFPDDFVAKPWGTVPLVYDAVMALGDEPKTPDEIWYSKQSFFDTAKFYFGYGAQAAQAKEAVSNLRDIYSKVFSSSKNSDDIELLGKIKHIATKIYSGYKKPYFFADHNEIVQFQLDKEGMVGSLIESIKIFQKIGLQSLAHREFQYSLDDSIAALRNIPLKNSTNKVLEEVTRLRQEVLNNCQAFLSDAALNATKTNECPLIQQSMTNNKRDTSNNPWSRNFKMPLPTRHTDEANRYQADDSFDEFDKWASWLTLPAVSITTPAPASGYLSK